MSQRRSRLLIVGAGPTGLSLAILLRLRGYDPVIVDREATPTALPAAHVVNTRSQEVFAEMGVAERMHASGDPTALYSNIVWAESLSGAQYGILSIPVPAQGEKGPFSAFKAVNIPQTLTETILRDRLTALGTKIEYGCSVVSVAPGSEEMPATVEFIKNGQTSRSDFDLVVGCDGAASTVRRSVGIEMEGPRTIARFMTIYFNADLDRWIEHRRALLYWIGGKDARGIFICFDKEARTWAMLVPIGDLPVETFSPEDALAIVRKAIGDDEAAITLIGLSSWNMSAQVAERYRNGLVLLAGDACHRFPPMGGLGMNTGVQDAHNLAWKISAILEGIAPFDLLDTYEEERRPIAQRNCGQSVYNIEKLGMIDEALGLQTLSPIESTAAKGSYQPYPREMLGLAGTSAAAAAKRAAVQHAIDQQGEHFGQGAGLDLGFVYSSRAITPDGSPPSKSSVDNYIPDAKPGARLPFLSPDGCYQNSTLAKVAARGVTVFAAGPVWADVCQAVSARTAIPVTVAQIDGWLPLPRALETLGIGSSGALAVRPDGHVFWRVGEPPADAVEALEAAVMLSHGCAEAAVRQIA